MVLLLGKCPIRRLLLMRVGEGSTFTWSDHEVETIAPPLLTESVSTSFLEASFSVCILKFLSTLSHSCGNLFSLHHGWHLIDQSLSWSARCSSCPTQCLSWGWHSTRLYWRVLVWGVREMRQRQSSFASPLTGVTLAVLPSSILTVCALTTPAQILFHKNTTAVLRTYFLQNYD